MHNESISRSTILRFSRAFLAFGVLIALMLRWTSRTDPIVQIGSGIIIILFFLYASLSHIRQAQVNRSYPLFYIFLALLWIYQTVRIPSAPLPEHAIEIQTDLLITLSAVLAVNIGFNRLWTASQWENAILILGLIISAVNLTQIVEWFIKWWNISDSINLTPPFGFRLPGGFLHHPNIEAAFINLLLPIILYRLTKSSRIKNLFLVVYAGMLVIILFFSSSRGAWIGSIASVISFTGIFILTNPFRFKKFRAKLQGLFNLKSILLLAGIFFTTIALAALFFLQSRTTPHARGFSARSGIWSIGLNIFKTAPVLGHGPGSFHVLSAVEAGIPPGFYLIHAHNLLIQIVAESGLIGGTLTALAALYFIKGSVTTTKEINNAEQLRFASYSAAIVSVLVHSLVDLPFESPLILFITLLFSTFLTQRKTAPVALEEPHRLRTYPLIILPIVIGVGITSGLRAELKYVQGITAATDGNWSIATKEICSSSEIDAEFRLYEYQCRLSNTIVTYLSADESYPNDYTIDEIQDGFDAYWAVNKINSAYLQWSLGQKHEAVDHLSNIAVQIPRNSTVHLNLGWMFNELGDYERSYYHYAQAVRLNPWVVRSSHIKSNSLDEAMVVTALQQYNNPSVLEAVEGWIDIDNGRFEQAQSHFHTAVELNPRRSEAYSGLAYIESISGNPEEVRYYLEMADLTQRSSYIDEQAKFLIFSERSSEYSGSVQKLDFMKIIFGINNSEEFYTNAYWRKSLRLDYFPQIIRGIVTPEIEHKLQRLQQESIAPSYIDFISSYLDDDVKR